jgi:CheY-like chemotaxis protein
MDSAAPILLAEDEDSDVFWFRRALAKAAIARPLLSFPNGREAMRYLAGDTPLDDSPLPRLPALIVLDLKMPIADGFDVLRWLQTRAELRHVPAVVLTSSDQPNDRTRAFELGARGYHVKPGDPASLVAIVRELDRLWLGHDGPGIADEG